MATERPAFNRILFFGMFALYLLTLATFIYVTWLNEEEFQQPWMLALNLLIISIPLVLLYGGIYVLLVAWRQRKTAGRIDLRLAKIIHWAPRLAAILIIFFTSLFSLDVFEMDASPLELLGGFLMHNIPSFVMLLMLVVAWKRPAVGFAAFLVISLAFAAFTLRNADSLPALLLFVLPLLVVALLFFADWKLATDHEE